MNAISLLTSNLQSQIEIFVLAWAYIKDPWPFVSQCIKAQRINSPVCKVPSSQAIIPFASPTFEFKTAILINNVSEHEKLSHCQKLNAPFRSLDEQSDTQLNENKTLGNF